jgi:hypothetical protein
MDNVKLVFCNGGEIYMVPYNIVNWGVRRNNKIHSH